MRKLLALLLVLSLAVFSTNVVYAQNQDLTEVVTTDEEAATGFQALKEKFIEGNWKLMSLVLICLILGLAFCIERIIPALAPLKLVAV